MRPSEQGLGLKCYYVKRVDDKHFEYGYYDENRKPHKTGAKPALEEALTANGMALQGQPRSQQGAWA